MTIRNKIQPSVLIVDGDEIQQILMWAWFQVTGYKVSMVKRGSDAIAAIKSGRPALVILDVDLPDMDGFDIMKTIKSRIRPLLVIINTGYAHHRADVRSFYADAFMIKSSNVEKLLTKAKELIGKRQASRNLPESFGLRGYEVLH